MNKENLSTYVWEIESRPQKGLAIEVKKERIREIIKLIFPYMKESWIRHNIDHFEQNREIFVSLDDATVAKENDTIVIIGDKIEVHSSESFDKNFYCYPGPALQDLDKMLSHIKSTITNKKNDNVLLLATDVNEERFFGYIVNAGFDGKTTDTNETENTTLTPA